MPTVLSCFLGVLLVLPSVSRGEPPPTESPSQHWRIGTESEVVLHGTSSVNEWSCRTDRVKAELTLPFTYRQTEHALQAWHRSPAESLNSFTNRVELASLPLEGKLAVEVEDLKSGNRKMEKDLQDALKANQYPKVVYELKSLEKVSSADGMPVFHILGALSMAGVTRELTLPFTLKEVQENAYLLESQQKILMSDFGVDPPTALFGLIKARNEVTVTYKLQITQASPPVTAHCPVASD